MMGEIVPTMPLGGNNNGGGWGDAAAAFGGALVGSALFGNGGFGFGGGGWGRGWGFPGGYGGGGNTGPVVINGDGGHCGSAELDALSNIQTSINGLGLNVLQGQNSANLAACQGFSGVVASGDRNTAALQNSMNQGFAGLNTVIQGGNAGIQQTLCQGFNGLQAAIAECCCKTQTAIHAEGEATRGLIQQNYINSLQEKLCDAKADNAALKTQNFISASQAAQTAQFQHQLDRQSVQFGVVLGAYRTGRIDERDSTATPAA